MSNLTALDDVTAHRVNELRAKDPAFIVGDQWHVLALADRMEACQGLLKACAPFLKDGETPAECIARNRKDTDSVLTLLAREKRKNEAFEAGRVNAPSGTTSEQVAIAPKGSACESPALLTSNPMIWSAQFECSECKAKHNVACSQPYFKVLEFQCLRCHATTMTDRSLARETEARLYSEKDVAAITAAALAARRAKEIAYEQVAEVHSGCLRWILPAGDPGYESGNYPLYRRAVKSDCNQAAGLITRTNTPEVPADAPNTRDAPSLTISRPPQ